MRMTNPRERERMYFLISSHIATTTTVEWMFIQIFFLRDICMFSCCLWAYFFLWQVGQYLIAWEDDGEEGKIKWELVQWEVQHHPLSNHKSSGLLRSNNDKMRAEKKISSINRINERRCSVSRLPSISLHHGITMKFKMKTKEINDRSSFYYLWHVSVMNKNKHECQARQFDLEP